MNKLRSFCYIKKNHWIISAIITAVALVLCMIISHILVRTGEVDNHEIKLIELIILAIYLMTDVSLFKCIHHVENVPKALGYGMTRRTYFIGNLLANILEALVMGLIAVLVSGGDYWQTIIKYGVFFTVIEIFLEGVIGNSVIKYGRKLFGIYYIIFVGLCVSMSKIEIALPHVADTINNFFNNLAKPTLMQPSYWCGITIAFVIALVINWLTFRKVEVRFIA